MAEDEGWAARSRQPSRCRPWLFLPNESLWFPPPFLRHADANADADANSLSTPDELSAAEGKKSFGASEASYPMRKATEVSHRPGGPSPSEHGHTFNNVPTTNYYELPSRAPHRTALLRSSISLLAPLLRDRRGSGNDRHNIPASLLDGTDLGHL
jgi:hypothetical protein